MQPNFMTFIFNTSTNVCKHAFGRLYCLKDVSIFKAYGLASQDSSVHGLNYVTGNCIFLEEFLKIL